MEEVQLSQNERQLEKAQHLLAYYSFSGVFCSALLLIILSQHLSTQRTPHIPSPGDSIGRYATLLTMPFCGACWSFLCLPRDERGWIPQRAHHSRLQDFLAAKEAHCWICTHYWRKIPLSRRDVLRDERHSDGCQFSEIELTNRN